MTTEYMIFKAKRHFLSNNTETSARVILLQYAKGELGLLDADIPVSLDRLSEILFTLASNTGEDHLRFFTWYYLTYVLPIQNGRNYTVEIYEAPPGNYVGTEIRPMRMAVRVDRAVPEKSDPDHAEFWSVLLLREGETLPVLVADCQDQSSAQLVQLMIHRIAPGLRLG